MKSYTDLEQSKKLAEILPIESADMYYFLDPTPAGNIYHLIVQRVDVGIKNIPQYNEGDIPCWSLTALLGVLPDNCGIDKEDGKYIASYIVSDECGTYTSDNPVDACVSMIEYLHKLKLL